MPVVQVRNIPYQVPTRIIEVNPLRETLTITNPNPTFAILADNNEPFMDQYLGNGILIWPYSRTTLEKKDGDRPDKAWYYYCPTGAHFILIFEGMTQPKPGWWWPF